MLSCWDNTPVVYIGIRLLFIFNRLSGRLWSEQWIFVIPLTGVLDTAAAYNCLSLHRFRQQSLETEYIVVFWKAAVLNNDASELMVSQVDGLSVGYVSICVSGSCYIVPL